MASPIDLIAKRTRLHLCCGGAGVAALLLVAPLLVLVLLLVACLLSVCCAR
jgi:hypothetical protein